MQSMDCRYAHPHVINRKIVAFNYPANRVLVIVTWGRVSSKFSINYENKNSSYPVAGGATRDREGI